MDVVQPDNSGDPRSSLKVTEPSNLYAQMNAATLMRVIHGASSFGLVPCSRGSGSGADAAWPFTNSGLAKLSGWEVWNIILPNTQSINRL